MPAKIGLDYTDQRYYASGYGRFNSPDPYTASAGTSDPGSWNRYAYTGGDPINRSDPRGLMFCGAEYENCDADEGYSDESGFGDRPGCPGFLAGMGFVHIPGPGCYAGEAVVAIINHPERTAPTPECPLVGIVGEYTFDPNSKTPIHALFAPDVALKLDAVFAVLNAAGIVPVLEDGFRTESEQADRQARYSAVAASLSWHEVGRAIDFKRSDPNAGAIEKAAD